jgi:sugar-specific transcriptional regulator TrmB
MSKPITNQLEQLGLSQNEASIYLELIKTSPASVSYLAKKLKRSRSTIYTAMERLITRGLVGVSYKNEVKQFVAESPSILESSIEKEQVQLDSKRGVVEGLMASLLSMQSGTALIPNIVFFEGKEQLKKIYMSMLRESPQDATMRIIRDEFVWDEEWTFVFKKTWRDRVRRWKTNKNITTQLLVNASKLELSKKPFYKTRAQTAVRFLQKKHQFNQFALYILADTISILSMEDNNLVGIKITNRHITQNFETLFAGLWEKAAK